jgi:hypothetical protein
MRESTSASALRILERELTVAHSQVSQLVDVVVEAANSLRDYDIDHARDLKVRAWTIAYTHDRGERGVSE